MSVSKLEHISARDRKSLTAQDAQVKQPGIRVAKNRAGKGNMKSLLELATETVLPDGGMPTENQENEIEALVKFGKRVLENAAQHSVQADVGEPRDRKE